MVTTKKAVSLNCQLATWAGETEINREDIPPFHSQTVKVLGTLLGKFESNGKTSKKGFFCTSLFLALSEVLP